jgi:hypothetical protein
MSYATKMLGPVLSDLRSGKIHKEQARELFQEAIDNGDILELANEVPVHLLVLPLIEKGELKTSPFMDEFKNRPESELMQSLRKRWEQNSKEPSWSDVFAEWTAKTMTIPMSAFFLWLAFDKPNYEDGNFWFLLIMGLCGFALGIAMWFGLGPFKWIFSKTKFIMPEPFSKLCQLKQRKKLLVFMGVIVFCVAAFFTWNQWQRAQWGVKKGEEVTIWLNGDRGLAGIVTDLGADWIEINSQYGKERIRKDSVVLIRK